jgi:hypothetical protein
VGWFIIISILVLQGVLEKLSLSSLKGSNLLPMRWLHLLQGAAFSSGHCPHLRCVWGVCPFLGGSFSPSVQRHCQSVHPVLPGALGDRRGGRLRAKEADVKWRQECQAFVNLWGQVKSQSFFFQYLWFELRATLSHFTRYPLPFFCDGIFLR